MAIAVVAITAITVQKYGGKFCSLRYNDHVRITGEFKTAALKPIRKTKVQRLSIFVLEKEKYNRKIKTNKIDTSL